MTTPDRTARRSVAITFVVPSHLETRPVTSTTWLPSSLRRLAKRSRQTMTCTSPVSSSMVTKTVPSRPRGCCLATGQPATVTHSSSPRRSTSTAGITLGPKPGLTNSIRCPLG